MSDLLMCEKTDLTNIADAIRRKYDNADGMRIENIPSLIDGIHTGSDTSDATATADDIVINKTAYTKDGFITGTNPYIKADTDLEVSTQSDLLSQIEEALKDKSGGVAIAQIATGTFTGIGDWTPILIDCGFIPDIVVISLPDNYVYYDKVCQNSIVFDMTQLNVSGDITERKAHNMNFYGSEDSYSSDIMNVGLYIYKAENGFYITSLYEMESNGNFWYSNKTYEYKAIKLDGGSVYGGEIL